jgi:hypothetical protein
MREKIEHANQQAREARERALLCRDKFVQDEWFKVAKLWGAIAREYEDLDALKTQRAANQN